MDGFINVLKPPGMTSHDVVSFARKILEQKKIGHLGTLDPGAAGVLPLAVGRAARLAEYLDDSLKSYRAELIFGIETDSGDDLGNILEKSDKIPDGATLNAAIEKFIGRIVQTPPVYSAIKINGKRAYELARKNIEVKIPGREVAIYDLKILDRTEKKALIDVKCSKGTYIRTLCADIGRYCGTFAAMSFLVRTGVGAFSLRDSVTLEDMADKGEKIIQPPEKFLTDLSIYELPRRRVKAFLSGLSTRDENFNGDDKPVMIFSEGIFLGIGKFDVKTRSICPEKIYAIQNNVQ